MGPFQCLVPEYPTSAPFWQIFTCHAHKLQVIPVRVHTRVVEFASAQEDTCGRFGKPGSDHQYPESCDSRWIFVFNFGAGRSSPSSRWICADNLTKLYRQRNDCRHSTGPCRTNQGYLVTSLQVELLHKVSLKMTKVCQRVCPSSIVSVSSLLYSVATCS